MKNNKVLFYHHDNELTFQNPFNVHSSFAPSTLPKNKINQIVLELERFARKLNLTDGILHAQIIANQLDFFIIELTRRCSGDLYPVPVEMVTNVPWSKVILKSFMGKKVNIPKSKGINKMYARHCLTANDNGFVKSIFIDSKIKENIVSKVIFLKNFKIIKDFKNEKRGVFILKFSNYKQMKEIMKDINKLIFIKTEVL